MRPTDDFQTQWPYGPYTLLNLFETLRSVVRFFSTLPCLLWFACAIIHKILVFDRLLYSLAASYQIFETSCNRSTLVSDA